MNMREFIKINTPIAKLRELMAAVAIASSTPVATAQTVVPEASNSATFGCPISTATFKSWFVSGSVTVNGRVNPPDNVNFSDKGTDCSFYQVAEQMFLWVTSPPLSGYGGGSYVFDSPVFHEVVPPAEGRPPALVAKSFERSKIASVGVPKRGPEGSVVVFDDAGKMYDIVDAGRRPFIETPPDRTKTIIGSIEIGADGMLVFLNEFGKRIELPLGQIPTLRDTEGNIIDFKMPLVPINAHGQEYFLDQSGKAIAVGTGQADSRVLMMPNMTAGLGTPAPARPQDDNLVYYMAQVNDVYVYFLTGTKNKKIMPLPTMFPTSQMELNAVKTYARIHGVTSFPDEKVLIVELKSSWIELPPDGNYGDYISIKAQVPNFEKPSNMRWTRKGLRSATLGMVGMHIAFSVQGHPELIWATFEHVNNAPNPRYQYWDRGNFRSFGPWLFSSGEDGTANQARMVMDGEDIQAINSKTTIGPSNVLRVSPWGRYQAQFTINPNTQVISTNNNVQGRLIRGDVRKNYMLVGATWLTGGTKQGSFDLANSTIETFFQPAGCFDCHKFGTNKLGGIEKGHGTGLSHIYGVLDPLFPDP
jgi:hypothetical protein